MILALVLACLPVEGDRVLARDFAAAWPALAALGDVQLGFAPVPGAQRTFHFSELVRLAARYGLDSPKGEICFQHPVQPVTAEQIKAAIEPMFPGARVTVREFARQPAPAGEIVFPRQGLRPDGIWRGWVRYAGNRRFPIWARVDVRISVRRVRALNRLPGGQPIAAGQVVEESVETAPSQGSFAEHIAGIIGRRPRGSIPAGAYIRLDVLEEVHDVERGDQVTVRVESGAARLALHALAETGGRRGDMIRLRNPETKKVFTARVEDKARAVVKAR